ncbi:MAG: phenylacetate-CoA oxygenase subunit PaaJ [Burkholderiales bacterium]|nr:phenylacetate-CoA oxygenase subunit PaaJ [Burkholderiales bacterium]
MKKVATRAEREAAAWAVLDTVPDPEVPALSLRDLGVVREVIVRQGEGEGESEREGVAGLEVVLTPTYSGCPATEVIAASVKAALEEEGLGPVKVTHRLAPAWTTDWISAAGRRKLREYGIAPPEHLGEGAAGAPAAQPIRLRLRAIACPRCGSMDTERLSAFGSTACKALHRCLACREPFEHFKPI